MSVTGPEAVERAFGAENRARLLKQFLDSSLDVTADNAWEHVYRLLLWIDRTTGLAHCYESDKCQPGRPWYGRSLAFHDWLAVRLAIEPDRVGANIDWLFKRATADLAHTSHAERTAAAEKQMAPYEGRHFPMPGEDAELVAIVAELLGDHLASDPSEEQWRVLTERVQAHLGQENKRKNLLGEGFEDALASILRRLPDAARYEVRNRALLGDVAGFHPQGETEKQKRVDLAMWNIDHGRRILVTSKWSVRADREEQFGTDFDAYVRVNSGLPFEYVLVTNEFDAARLKAACERLSGNAYLFSCVVHVNVHGVLSAYGANLRGAARSLSSLIDSGRLMSLSDWLEAL